MSEIKESVSKNLRTFFINISSWTNITKKIHLKLIKSDELELSNISRKSRKKFEELAKKKYPNDPNTLKKATLEAKDIWLTKERMNEFKEKTIHRKKAPIADTHYGIKLLEFEAVLVKDMHKNLTKDMQKIEKNIERSSLVRWIYSRGLERNDLSKESESKLKKMLRKRQNVSLDMDYVGQDNKKELSENDDN